MVIYFPMSARVLTPGHIKCLRYLISKGTVIVGLLTAKAMEGYKDETVPYEDRKYILENLCINFKIVPQESLDPTENLKTYKCDAIASGDGWEKEEIESAQNMMVDMINIKLEWEEEKQYSSSKILQIWT